MDTISEDYPKIKEVKDEIKKHIPEVGLEYLKPSTLNGEPINTTTTKVVTEPVVADLPDYEIRSHEEPLAPEEVESPNIAGPDEETVGSVKSPSPKNQKSESASPEDSENDDPLPSINDLLVETEDDEVASQNEVDQDDEELPSIESMMDNKTGEDDDELPSMRDIKTENTKKPVAKSESSHSQVSDDGENALNSTDLVLATSVTPSVNVTSPSDFVNAIGLEAGNGKNKTDFGTALEMFETEIQQQTQVSNQTELVDSELGNPDSGNVIGLLDESAPANFDDYEMKSQAALAKFEKSMHGSSRNVDFED